MIKPKQTIKKQRVASWLNSQDIKKIIVIALLITGVFYLTLWQIHIKSEIKTKEQNKQRLIALDQAYKDGWEKGHYQALNEPKEEAPTKAPY